MPQIVTSDAEQRHALASPKLVTSDDERRGLGAPKVDALDHQRRREQRFEPDVPPPPPGRSWIATGIYLMVLPMTLSAQIMFAPVSWLLAVRSKR